MFGKNGFRFSATKQALVPRVMVRNLVAENLVAQKKVRSCKDILV